MSYIGRGLETGSMRQLDDLSSGFDGSDTTHTMQINSVDVDQSVVGDVNQLILSLGGVIQKPGTDFTVSGSTLTFTTAPAANTSFFCVVIGGGGGFATPGDQTVVSTKMSVSSLWSDSDASNSIWVGSNPASTVSTAQYNTAYGLTALDAITTGDDNVALGFNAAGALTTGGNNIAIGSNAMYEGAVTGSYNVAIGGSALRKLTDGPSNVAIGVNSLEALTTGDRNIAVGMSSSTGYDTENDNLAIGHSALAGSVAGGEYNVAIGNYSLDALTSGDNNVAIGYNAGTALTTSNDNVLIGYNAAENATTLAENVVIGHEAMGTGVATSGYNVAIGKEAALQATSMSESTIIGYQAGEQCTTASHVIFIGYTAGDDHDTENHNIGIGASALGGSIAGGEYNVAVGNYGLDAVTSGDINTGVGNKAGSGVTTGTGNVLFGHQAGDYSTAVTTGNYNICLGSYTRTSATGSANQIVIGADIAGGEDSQITIGKASNIIQNEFDTDNAWTQSSDVRKKKNIKDAVLGLDFVNDLRPVTYEWKPNNEFPKDFAEYSEENHMTLDVTMHGMVAQEVKAALDKTGVDRFGGWQEDSDGCQRLSKEMFVFPLIKAVQELSAQVTTLQQEINTLKEGK